MRHLTLFASLLMLFSFVSQSVFAGTNGSVNRGQSTTINWDVSSETCTGYTTYDDRPDGTVFNSWNGSSKSGNGSNVPIGPFYGPVGAWTFGCEGTPTCTPADSCDSATLTVVDCPVWSPGTTWNSTTKACEAAASPCATQTLSWGAGSACSASVTGVASGATSNGNDSSTPNTGIATFSCSNGTWTLQGGSTCTVPPTISSFTNNGPIANNTQATLSWNTSGATSCSIDGGIGAVTTGNSSTNTGNLVSNTTYTLTCSNAGGSVTQTTTVTVGAAASGSFTSTPSCIISSGNSGCSAPVSWTSANVATVYLTDCSPSLYTTTGSGAQSSSVFVPYNTGCYQIRNGATNGPVLASVAGNSSCVAGTSWDGSSCAPTVGMSGSITPAVGSCTIASGSDRCLIGHTWSVSNPEVVGGTSVTRSNDGATITSGSDVSPGNVNFNTIYPGTTFSLRNNGKVVATASVTASCTAGTSWDGSKCAVASMSGTLSASSGSCTISSGASSCSVNLTWTTSNPVSTSAVTRNNPNGTDFNGNNGGPSSVSLSGAYGSVTFYLYNNASLLAQTTVSVSCTGGTSWDGSQCSPSGAPDLTTDSTTPSSANSGVSTTLGTTVRNVGSTGTGAGFQMFFQIATAANGGGTVTDLGANGVGALCSGCSVGTTKTYVFPSAGTYSVRACSDKASSASSGVISESNEGNNCSTWTNVTVTSASASVSISPSTNQTINLGDILAFSSTANYPASDLTRHSIFWEHNGIWNWYPYTELDGQPAAGATKFWDYAGTNLSTHTINVKPLESGSYTILWAGRNDSGSWPSDGPHCGDAGITCSTSVSVTVNAATSLSGNNCTIPAYSSTCRGTPLTVNNPVFAFYDLFNESTGITTSNAFFAGNGYTYNPGWDGTAASIKEGTNILRLRQGGMGTNLATLFAVGTCAGGSTWDGSTCVGNGPAVPAIDGPVSGVPGTSYTFGFQADDPNGWSISYLIDWDNNGTVDETLGSAPHNTRLTTTRSWGTTGAKTFRAKTRNFLAEESGWTTWTITLVNQPVADFTLSPNPVKTGNLYNLDLTPSTNALKCKVERKTDAAPSYTTALACWSAASNMTPFDRAVTLDGLAIGTNQYRVTCYSDAACTQNASVPVVKNLTITPPNTAPSISISPNVTINREPGQSATFTSILTDVDDNITQHNIDWSNGTDWSYTVGVNGVTGVTYSALTNLTNTIGSFAVPTGSNTGSVTLTFDRPGSYQVQAAAYDIAWNFAVPAAVTINVACPATKTWDPLSGTCQLPSGTLSATPNACLINTLASTCPVNLDWTTSFPIGISSITRDGTPGDLYTGNTGISQLTNVPYESDGSVVYREYNNSNPIAMTTVSVSCKPGEGWDNIGGVCADPRVTSKDVSGEFYPPGKISFTCNNSSNAWEVTGGVVAPSTGVYVFPQTIEVEPTVSGTYTITCKHGDYAGPDETIYYNSAPPPAPKISLTISPRSVAKGEKITLSWDVQFPIGACKLEAKAVCANGICSPTQLATESSFNLKLINETTNIDDPYGVRPIPVAVNTFATGHTPTDHPTDWKALGRKTFTIGSTMDFSLDCGAGNQETKRAQVIKTEEQ